MLEHLRETHHITPRHRGGTNDPNNLIELSLVDHCLWHWCEWQRTGDPKDFTSYQIIKGKINWYRKGCPANLPPDIKKGSRDWKIARLYAMHGGKIWSCLRSESVDSLYARMNRKGKRVKYRRK